MGIKRQVDTSLWSDPKIVDSFTAEDKYFWLYCLTNPHNSLCGIANISEKTIANEMGYSSECVINLLQRFEQIHKLICYNKENKEMLIVNWHKYNWTSSDKLRLSVQNQLKQVKTPAFIRYIQDILDGIDTVSIPYGYLSISISNTISISNKKPKGETKGKSNINPTKDEVEGYAKARGREDLAKQFYDYYTATNWHDKDGKPVKSWKGKFITWEGRNPPPSSSGMSKYMKKGRNYDEE